MTRRLPCPPAPGPLEAHAARFDDLFSTLAQRRGFREYLAGLLLPRDRNKTLTCLAGTEPLVGAQHPSVQRLQFFLSESTWDHEQVNARRVELLLADPATAPHSSGVLVIDDSGDRKDGKATAHVGRQWLGRLGKTDNGIVTVTTCWADENLYYPLHAQPYTPAHRLPEGKSDPEFRTKLQIAADLARTAKAAGVAFRAVAADCGYGDQNGFRRQLDAAGLPFVMALKPSHGTWAYGKDAYTPVHAARALAWTDPEHPGDWTPVERTFRDGHTETRWAADARLGWWGPGRTRLGRLPGPLRHRHPPPPDPGHLRVLVLLGYLVRPTTRDHARNSPTEPPKEPGRPERAARADLTSPTRPAGPGRSAPSGPGSPHGAASTATGGPGPTSHRHRTPSTDQRGQRRPPA
ncbi:transposase [Streptomyces sp. H34-S4]|nr:transposase [Streptomyces sp. H34-S4]MCY0938964.1 transposase [Streptomyces sp. H34-S4]